jgi:hypothetical protein
MIASTIILLCSLNSSSACDAVDDRAIPQGSSGRAAEFDNVLFLDRLHQTFLLLIQVALPAYREHFRDEPDKLAVVQYYTKRLTEVLDDRSTVLPSPPRSDEAIGSDAPRDVLMLAALAELHAGRSDSAERHLKALGVEPHAELQRIDDSMPTSTARCPLYDPELLSAHRQLWQLKTGRPAPTAPSDVSHVLKQQHAAVQSLRQQVDDSELSMRKFLDKHRRVIWELGWMYRCRGMELVADPDAARVCFLRAWTIGDALFPVSERGRIDRFDPVFLAELGDVYARLGRYDLMLRYIYCDEGLSARFEMAKPVAELARVAESVRLARAEGSTDLPLEKQLPETVSQILFEQPVVNQPNPVSTNVARPAPEQGNTNVGWILLASGACLIGGAITWRLVRMSRRPESRAWPES